MPDIYTFGFENETEAIWKFYFRFRFWPHIVSCMWYCSSLPNLSKLDHLWLSYDVISIFHMAAMASEIYLTGFLFGDIWHLRRQRLSMYKISPRYPRLRYYYFRFLEINGRHFEISHLVSILTISSPLACGSASADQILSELDDR